MINTNQDVSIALEILSMKLSKNIFNKDELKQILKEKELVIKNAKK